MGKPKFRVSVQRKNEVRKKKLLKDAVKVNSAATNDTITSSEQLYQQMINKLTFPQHWIIVSADPLTICKMKVSSGSAAQAIATLSISKELEWTMYYLQYKLSPSNCPLLTGLPSQIESITTVMQLMELIDASKPCAGNNDAKFIENFEQRKLTLHGSLGSQVCWLDNTSSDNPIIRHKNCQWLIAKETACERCSVCVSYRTSLTIQSQQSKSHDSGHASLCASHVNYRYQPLPTIVDRLVEVQKQYRLLVKQCNRQKLKIAAAEAAQTRGIAVDDDLHQDLKSIALETHLSVSELPSDSFRRIFWEQQVEAAKQNDARTMRWHPLMIRWCLYLRHRSSGAYETLRDSGCLHLPSQRTLRDYVHYEEASVGFSSGVDKMLMQAAKLDTCHEREKYVLLLLDEMHIREDLVYDKHSGALVGFTNLGTITMHLLNFEKEVAGEEPPSTQLAKTVMVFMVRGLFNSLQFPYAQFPCGDLSGEQLFDPLWEAVRRIETCGLKVLGATLDGNSVNRRLIKLHSPTREPIYKVKNPFAIDKREFYFIPDPPHLIKTARNCWQSQCRHLWNNGKSISWSHLANLYNRDTASGLGVRMVPKLKLEHIALTSFSKMRVDLAAQVLSESVSKALKLIGGNEAEGTSKFTEMMDKFFDCLNVHNYKHGIHSRKKFQMPYTSADDPRLKWLKAEFIKYLNDWENSVKERTGFSKTEKATMVMSQPTREGLKMACNSFVELVQYLFTIPDVSSFLSQRICQDALERFFGCQRQRGGVHDNPNIQEFMKNTQALRVVNCIAKPPKKGNCRGGQQDLDVSQENVPLSKRPRQASKK